MGSVVGSFVNVVADRVPLGQSMVSARSYCPSCGTTLGTLDLLPVLSYLWLRGRCRYCGAVIPGRLAVVETVTGLLYLGVFLRHGFGIEFSAICVAITALMTIAVTDFEHGRLPVRVWAPATAAALVAAPFWTELGLARQFFVANSLTASLFSSLVAGAGAFLLFQIPRLAYPRRMGPYLARSAALTGLAAGYPLVLGAAWVAAAGLAAAAVVRTAAGQRSGAESLPATAIVALAGAVALAVGPDVTPWGERLLAAVSRPGL